MYRPIQRIFKKQAVFCYSLWSHSVNKKKVKNGKTKTDVDTIKHLVFYEKNLYFSKVVYKMQYYIHTGRQHEL